LHTAQALVADHVPAKILGMHSAWIDREDQEDLLKKMRGQVEFTWRFQTMGEMANEVKAAFKEAIT